MLRHLFLAVLLFAGFLGCRRVEPQEAPVQDAGDRLQLTLLKTLVNHSDTVTALAFSPDGKTLASGSHDRNIVLWSMENGTIIRILKGHNYWVSAIAFAADGKTLVSASNQDMSPQLLEGKVPIEKGGPRGEVIVWDIGTGRLQRKLGRSAPLRDGTHPDLSNLYPATALALWPNRRTVAVGSWFDYVRFWDVDTGAFHPPLLTFRGFVQAVAFADNASAFAVGCSDGVHVFALTNGSDLDPTRSRVLDTQDNSHTYGIAFSPGGKTLATVASSKIAVWDAETGAVKQRLETKTLSTSAAFSPDGKMLAVFSGVSILLWDTATGTVKGQVETGHDQSPIAFSPDGHVIATGGWSLPGGEANTVSLWSIH